MRRTRARTHRNGVWLARVRLDNVFFKLVHIKHTLMMEGESSALVVVVGSCMTDLVSYVSRLPKPGETIHGSSFCQGFGGKGANQCVMAAKLGAPSAMVARLGDDIFGHKTLQNFRDNKIDASHVTITEDVSSGVAAITVNDQGENSIVIVSGANDKLSPADVEKAESLISSAAVVICQLEVPPETSLAALALAKTHGVTTIFNTAPGVKSLGLDYFSNTDILCLNETEAEVLTGVPVPDLPAAYNAVNLLQSFQPGSIVLTLGEKGLLFSQRDKQSGKWSTVEHVEAEKVEAIDSTGAGDAFVGALAYYLAQHSNLPFREMLKRSGTIASHTVKAKGTQSSYNVDALPKKLLE